MLRSFILLRHASAGDPATWRDGDRSRPLDLIGLAQSAALTESFAQHPIDRILTSPFARCHHTVATLAATRRLPVVDADWLGRDADREQRHGGLGELVGDVLVCTHREAVPDLIEWLLPGRAEYDSVLDKAAALAIHYDGGEPELTRIPAPTASETIVV